MTPEKSQNILGNLKDNFDIKEHEKEFREEQGGMEVEYVIFHSPLGLVKLEFMSKPVVLDKKTNYSRRIGSETKVEYVYSDTEKTHTLTAYQWNEDEDDWTKIQADSFL